MMDPRIEERGETILVGLVTHGGDIHTLWTEFMPLSECIPNREAGKWYEYHAYPPGHKKGDPFYVMAAVAVSKVEELPETAFVRPVPGGTYAVFTHDFADGGYDVLNPRINAWLESGPYKIIGGVSVQVYDERFKGIGVPGSVLELMVRVEPKAA